MQQTYIAAICLLAIAGLPASAQQATQSDGRVADLVKAGTLRIGVFPSFQFSKDPVTGQPRGLALGIASAIAKHIGLGEVAPVEFPTPPQVITCVKTGGCDVGFMLIDPARATEVDFTPAFVRSDSTYLVSAKSTLEKATDADRSGVRIAVVRGHASTIALERMVKQAQLVYADTYDPTFELLRSGNAEALASIREILIQYSSQLPGSRVLKDSYLTNLAGIALPKGNSGRLSFLTEFLSGMKRSGVMQRLVNEAGLRGVEVADDK
jgi:polar amino acid transport system substrate-binding protein